MSVSVFDAVLFNLRDPALQWASLWCCVGPFTWNILCRLEFYGGLLSRAFGSKKVGCAALALYILAVGWYRDYVVKIAMDSQPKVLELASDNVFYAGAALLVLGQTLVLTSFYQLGFFGTFLGDYFGLLADAPVTAFPFNFQWLSNPMYVGATMSFGGIALMKQSVAGLLLTLQVYIVYRIALAFEEPFTNYIYSERARKQSGKAKKK